MRTTSQKSLPSRDEHKRIPPKLARKPMVERLEARLAFCTGLVAFDVTDGKATDWGAMGLDDQFESVDYVKLGPVSADSGSTFTDSSARVTNPSTTVELPGLMLFATTTIDVLGTLGNARVPYDPVRQIAHATPTVITIHTNHNESFVKVDFFVDGTLQASDMQAPFQFEWDASNKQGSHAVIAKAYDSQNEREIASEELTVVISTPWHNKDLAPDVDGDGIVSPVDTLLIINGLNSTGARRLPDVHTPVVRPYLDVYADGYVNAIDALMVINYLNSPSKDTQAEGLDGALGATIEFAKKLEVGIDEVNVVSIESVDWPDTGLGCAEPEEIHFQKIVPGHRIKLRAGSVEAVYHTSGNSSVRSCES